MYLQSSLQKNRSKKKTYILWYNFEIHQKEGIGNEILNVPINMPNPIDEASVSEIAFDDPVDVDEDYIPNAEFEAFVSNSGIDIGKLSPNCFYVVSLYFIIIKDTKMISWL